MQDHPIPQAVTSYEFHLIGNMTLKQFLELAAGIVIGVLIFQTNLPDVVKWPLIVFFVALGAMIAFVPYEGRPLDQWFVALFRAIYKPTQFYWRKSGDVPSFLTFTKASQTILKQEVDLSPYKQRRIQEYITTLPSQLPQDPLELEEQQQLSNVLSLFDSIQVTQVEAVEQIEKPDLTTAPRPLQAFEAVFETEPVQTPVEEVRVEEIPLNIPVEIEIEQPQPVQEVITEPQLPQNVDIFSQTAPTAQSQPTAAQTVQTSSALPFPKKPTQPNIVVGMVFDAAGNIVENAIVEINDTQGMPVRAVKTNSIGQFYISTPLKNGEYYLKVEKDGILFPDLKLELNNTILDPVEIKGNE